MKKICKKVLGATLIAVLLASFNMSLAVSQTDINNQKSQQQENNNKIKRQFKKWVNVCKKRQGMLTHYLMFTSFKRNHQMMSVELLRKLKPFRALIMLTLVGQILKF